jgi:hypothetical protein
MLPITSSAHSSELVILSKPVQTERALISSVTEFLLILSFLKMIK